MKILAIETSCDETAAAIISKVPQENYVKLLSNIVVSSLTLHSKTGGIVPEIAAREQVRYIIPVIKKAIENCKLKIENLDAIAVTMGPGLIGSLLVGVETAKTLAYLWKKPIMPVNHLLGHMYANFIQRTDDGKQKTDTRKTDDVKGLSSVSSAIRPQSSVFSPLIFPAIALIVSGGHTDLILLKSHGRWQWIGGTLDDAAGEAFDKIGRLLKIPYPAGSLIERLAKNGNEKAFNFPRPMIYSKDFDFSFSGLKTAVFRETKTIKQFNNKTISDVAASFQQAIVDVLVRKTLKAAKKYNVKSILLGGGVAANQKLRKTLEQKTKDQMPTTKLFCPQKSLCTDNAAMIGAYAAFNYKPIPWKSITANPQLYLI